MIYILYIILGLVIGTIIIHSKKIELYNQITKNQERSTYSDLHGEDLVFNLVWHYVLWPFPLFSVLWFLFWEYLYISLQYIVIVIGDIGKLLRISLLKKK